MRGRLLAAAVLAAALAALPAWPEPAEIATGCPVRELQLAGAGESTLVLWRQGGAGAKGKKAGCPAGTRAAWLTGGKLKPLADDVLGAGFAQANSGARAATLEGGRLLLVWAESGAIHGAFFGAGQEQPERRFLVTPADDPSDVAAPRPLAKAGGGFVVIYESDFFSGRRRNPVWRAFSSSAEPAGEAQPAFADFVSVRDPLAAILAGGPFAVGGPGIGPVGDGFFLQFWGADGESLGEPVAAGGNSRYGAGVLGGELAAAGDDYVFTWNMRAGKGEEKAWVRLYGADGNPLAAARELGKTASAPALGAAGGKVLLAFAEPAGPEARIRLLELDPAETQAGNLRPGPALPEATATTLAVEARQRLLAYTAGEGESARIVVVPWP